MEKFVKESKWLSYVLRHDQAYADACMDDEGYVHICDLIRHARKEGYDLDYTKLEQIVHSDDKGRYSIIEGNLHRVSETGIKQIYLKIRANQGHSIKQGPKMVKMDPPEYLYHGTAGRFVAPILEFGLSKQKRQHVHLSSNSAVAYNVGKRHGSPVVFVVLAQKMVEAGYEFYKSENNVWLTDNVPPEYLILGSSPYEEF